MNDDLWYLLDERLEHGAPVDDLIPYDLSGLCESDFLKLLALEATYGADADRAKICRKKLIELEAR